MTNSLAIQHGGTHYIEYEIEPAEYVLKNRLGFAEGNVVKYVTRHAKKGHAEDIKKAIHYLRMLLEFEYKVTSSAPNYYEAENESQGKAKSISSQEETR